MKIKHFLFYISLAVSLSGCINNEAEKKAAKGPAVLTAIDLDARLKQTDSIVVVFYKDPYGTDSLRYTRYYTQLSVTKNQ